VGGTLSPTSTLRSNATHDGHLNITATEDGSLIFSAAVMFGRPGRTRRKRGCCSIVPSPVIFHSHVARKTNGTLRTASLPLNVEIVQAMLFALGIRLGLSAQMYSANRSQVPAA